MGSKPTVLFVHGMFMTGRSWARWAERFDRKGYTCLAPDWPGRDGAPSTLRQSPPDALRTLTLTQVVDQFAALAKTLDTPPLLVGHSMGGLVVQLLLARAIGARAVAVDPAPPFGVKSFALSHLRANAPVLFPGSSPIVPTVASWRYAFWHTGSDAEVGAAFDAEVVPESRVLGRGPLGAEAKIDFAAKRAPLLIIAGENDHIVPSALNRKNADLYDKANAPTEFVEMPGRTHYLCGQPGWEEVADRALAFLER